MRLYAFKNSLGACALIFPDDSAYTSALLVSTPPPEWLSDEDKTKICITESGMYCLYFLFFAEGDTLAYISINGRRVPGSAITAEDGVACSCAVCSIHDAALPCALSVVTEPRGGDGIFLVARCVV